MNAVKRALSLVLPTPVIDRIRRIHRMQISLKVIDLSRISLIREKSLEYLSDPQLLETDLLPRLGLNNEELTEFPEELYPYCGNGLFYWQYPSQFSKYLTLLSKYNIESYLEIGTRHGGTFVITVEYLQKFHPLKYSIGIDISKCPSLEKYATINSTAKFFRFDSQSTKFENFLAEFGTFDLVLVDGCHGMEACMHDFETIKNRANIIVFHDIISDSCPGVVKIWNQVKVLFPNAYKFYEFVEQYDSVRKRTGKRYLGIGVAIKNSILSRSTVSS